MKQKKQEINFLGVFQTSMILTLLLLGSSPLTSRAADDDPSKTFTECVGIQEDFPASRCIRRVLLDSETPSPEEATSILTQILSVLDEGKFETAPVRYASHSITIQLMFRLIASNHKYPFLGHANVLEIFKSVIIPKFQGLLSRLDADLIQAHFEPLAQGLYVFHTWNREITEFLNEHRSELVHLGFDLMELHRWYFSLLRHTSVPEVEAVFLTNMSRLPPTPRDFSGDFNFGEYAQAILQKLQNSQYLLPPVLAILQKSNWSFSDIQSVWPFEFQPEGAESVIRCLSRYILPALPPSLQHQSIVGVAHQMYISLEDIQEALGTIRAVSGQLGLKSEEVSGAVSSLESLSEQLSVVLQQVHERRLKVATDEQKSALVLDEIKNLKSLLSSKGETGDFDHARMIRVLLHEIYKFARGNMPALTKTSKVVLANTLMEALLFSEKFLSPLNLTPSEHAQFQQSLLDELMQFPLMHEDFSLATQVSDGERIKPQFFPHFLLIHRVPGVTLSLAKPEHKVAYLNILKTLADARAYAVIGYRETYRHQFIADSINGEFRRPEGSPLALAYCSSLRYVNFDNSFQIHCQDFNCTNIPPFRRWEVDPDLTPIFHLVASGIRDKSLLPEFYDISLRLNEVGSSVRRMLDAMRDTILYTPALSKMLNKVIKDEFVGCVKEVHMRYGQISESYRGK